MNYAAMGAKIKATRKKLRLTQEQLAEIVGISASFMGHIEKGSRIASIDTLFSLCRALNVSADYLIGLSEETAIKAVLSGFTQDEISAGVKLLQRLVETQNEKQFIEIH